MNIKIGMPEFLIAGACILGCNSQSIAMWIFFGVGLFGAIYRAAMEQQRDVAKAKLLEENMGDIRGAAAELGNMFLGMGSRDPGNIKH